MTNAPPLRYVLITPARNEATFLEQTAMCVVRQTARPEKWVIVSDGSTDGTDEIAQQLDGVTYDVIGNLDADLTFDDEYFAFLLEKFAANPRLGVAGTPFRDQGVQYDFRFSSVEHVSGACQLFRRECFEDIGGYVPMKLGGIDHVAVITARMRGWKTRTFPEKHCVHHRKMGSALHGRIRAIYRVGVLDYALGCHPLWEMFRAAYQATQRPRIVRGVVLYTGYLAAAARRLERPVSAELVAFRRGEQMRRLRAFILDRIQATRRASTFRTALHPEEGRPINGIARQPGGPVQ
jgi:glycosyltransferase involved in cell wall biosynthesis